MKKMLLSLVACLFSGLMCAQPIHHIVVFGDSLSDNGNLYTHMQEKFPPSPPYYQGHFSDGPVWVEYLRQFYFPNKAKRLIDLAFGGAMVTKEPNDSPLYRLDGQVDTYLAYPKKKDFQHDLFIFWIGSNNYIGAPEDKEQKLVKEVNDGITYNIERLVQKGAANILILNLPNIGDTPFAEFIDKLSCPTDVKCISPLLSAFSKTHNELLAQNLEQLKSKYPQVNWMYYEIDQLLKEAKAHPEKYKLHDTNTACYAPKNSNLDNKSILELVTDVKEPTANTDCDGYLFFDLLHPTTFAHKLIAEKIESILLASNLEPVLTDDWNH